MTNKNEMVQKNWKEKIAESKFLFYLLMTTLIIAIIGALSISFLVSYPEKYFEWTKPKIEITKATFLEWGGDNKSAAVYQIDGEYYNKKENYEIIVFTTAVNEDSWTLQMRGNPLQEIRLGTINSRKNWNMKIYIGDRQRFPEQREFDIFAVIVNSEEALHLVEISSKTPEGIPFYEYKSEIIEKLDYQIWSKPFLVTLPP